ncbi:MAG: PTS sugar transporter subunit IIA [Acidobacteriota bacterium]|nr:PTS sugar transporter subunit IIA [Acidobacteriota bacterium]
MPLTDLIHRHNIVLLESHTKQAVLEELVCAAARNPQVKDEESLLAAILDRESEYTTGIGFGLAVPHARVDAVTERIVVLGRSIRPIDFQALDGQSVSIFVLIAVGTDQHKEYIRALARFAQALKQGSVREAVLRASNPDEIYTVLEQT